MKKLLLLSLIICSAFSAHAQKKSELIAEIDELKKKLDSTQNLITEANRKEKASTARAESFESQVTELQDANATLLKNLNSFAEVSNKNSSAINQALASLEAKENQLKGITDAISRNDSTAIVLLTNTKQTLGEDAKVKVAQGAVVISNSLDALFGSDTGEAVTETASPWLNRVADILKSNPEVVLTVEGLSMTGDIDLASRQARAITGSLQKDFGIDANRLASRGRDGNLKEGVDLKLHPNFGAFYLMVREDIKN
ncbi:MAG: hypothetical protein AAF361_15340 [Bacteroidota bacterium]